MFHIKPRKSNVRPFIGLRQREDGAAGGVQLGFTTYGTTTEGQETYKVSYVELAGRSDHLSDAVNQLQGNEVTDRLVANASADDVNYVGTVEQNAQVSGKPATDVTATAIEPSIDPAAACAEVALNAPATV